MDDQVKVLLADGHSLFREAMRVVLDAQDDLVVVAEAGDGVQAVVEAGSRSPDVALVDLNLPNSDGLRTIEGLADAAPGCRSVLLSEHDDEELLVRALEAGAAGFVSRSSPIGDLLAATRRVHRGETVIPPMMLGGLLARLIARRREHDDALRRIARLTRREREVLALLAAGADNAAIAQPLVISTSSGCTRVSRPPRSCRRTACSTSSDRG
jgi:DNA-binding NarL/FixJ family response regulator